MSFQDDPATRRDHGLSLGSAGYGSASGDWIEPEREPRDWKKLFLVLGLGALSWVATYVGMLELIESNMGDLPILHKVIIGFSVAMLMTMIIWLLDQIFSPIPLTQKLVYVFGYLFLTLISVGFGFGFYWKVLESRGEATRSAESAVGQVQTALHAGSTRLEQLSATLDQLTTLSSSKAVEEREKGTSCPNSSPGDGPRRKLRDADAQQFSFAGDFVKSRVDNIRTQMAGLDTELVKISDTAQSTVDPDSGTRNEFMRALNRRLDLTVTGFNAFRSDPQLSQIRGELAERAERTVFPNGGGGTFACPDAQLQTALRGVVRAIDQLPVMTKPQIAAVEGAEATIEAFRRLSATIQGALVFELPPSADELRALQKKAVQSVANGTPAALAAAQNEPVGLSKRDYIPLAIAIFVDFCLLLVSIGRPMNRLNGLVPVMREAERGPMIKILSRFNDIHRDPEIRQNFEVFRHVVFDMHGAYYVAVPLDAPYRPTGRGAQAGFGYGSGDAQELQHEAHLLANLFSGFEQQRIFTRVYNPFLTTKAIQKKLWRQGSKFAGCQAFRVYRFRDGAWSNMILQAVMGAAKRAEEVKRTRIQAEAMARASNPVLPDPAVETAAGTPHTGRPGSNGYAPIEVGLSHAPDVAARRRSRRAEPGEAAAERPPGPRTAGSYQVYSGRGRRPAAADEEAVTTSRRPSRRRTPKRPDAAAPAAPDEASLRQAFGRYANRAAAEFSADFADPETDLDGLSQPANANTAPSQPSPSAEAAADAGARSPNRTASRDTGADKFDAPHPGASSAPDVVIALSDRRSERVPAADVRFTVADPFGSPGYGPSRPVASGAVSLKAAAPAFASEVVDGRTQVTLIRETATFEMPVAETAAHQRLAGAAAAAAAAEAAALQEANSAPDSRDWSVENGTDAASVAPLAAIAPPPLPDWARAPQPQIAEEAEFAEVTPDADEVADEVAEDGRFGATDATAAETDDDARGWEVTRDPFADDDDDDETIVTIARRLRPQTAPAE